MQKIILLILGITLVQCSFASDLTIQPQEDPLQSVQDLFNGFWEQANLSDPTGLAASCFNETSAQVMIDTANATLQALVANNLVKALQIMKVFASEFPDINKCMLAEQTVKDMLVAYDVTGLTYAQISVRLGGYVISHLSQVKGEITNGNNDFQSGNFVQAGKDAGVFVQQVFVDNDELVSY